MRVVYFGTPDFAVESLDAIMQSSRHEMAAVVTVPDRQAGRGQKVVYSPVKQYALDHQLPLLQPEKLRDTQFLEDLQAIKADIFVVVAFRMLPEAVWAMPPHGTFNLHASLLPRYRGAAPINWAIINGEQETGVTTFLLNHQIDEGNLLLQESTPISTRETAGSLHDRLAAMGRSLVVRTLDALADGTVTPRPQIGEACPAPKIFKDDCRIDFSHTSQEIDCFIRGLCPYPAATLTLINPKGESIPFKILAAESMSEMHEYPCGTLICDGKRVLKIATADGFIRILELQMAGKKKNNVEDFLRGNNITNWKLV
ncbi:MAG: methionyl-tRNA formyltransferase [Bacteroidales bacterium]|nr:methionyl-tRNA formyltransferase [Bacteroidales bacterium]